MVQSHWANHSTAPEVEFMFNGPVRAGERSVSRAAVRFRKVGSHLCDSEPCSWRNRCNTYSRSATEDRFLLLRLLCSSLCTILLSNFVPHHDTEGVYPRPICWFNLTKALCECRSVVRNRTSGSEYLRCREGAWTHRVKACGFYRKFQTNVVMGRFH